MYALASNVPVTVSPANVGVAPALKSCATAKVNSLELLVRVTPVPAVNLNSCALELLSVKRIIFVLACTSFSTVRLYKVSAESTANFLFG